MHSTAVPEVKPAPFLPIDHSNEVVKALYIALNEVQEAVGSLITSETGKAFYAQLCNDLSTLIKEIVYPFPSLSTPADQILYPKFTAIIPSLFEAKDQAGENEQKLIAEFKNFCQYMAHQKYSELERAETCVLKDAALSLDQTVKNLNGQLYFVRSEQKDLEKQLAIAAANLKKASQPWAQPKGKVEHYLPDTIAGYFPQFINNIPIPVLGHIVSDLDTSVEKAVDRYLKVAWKAPEKDFTIEDLQATYQDMKAQITTGNEQLFTNNDAEEKKDHPQNSIFSSHEQVAIGVGGAIGAGTAITGACGYAGVGLLATVWHPVGWAVLILAGVLILLTGAIVISKKIYDRHQEAQQQKADIDITFPSQKKTKEVNERTSLLTHDKKSTLGPEHEFKEVQPYVPETAKRVNGILYKRVTDLSEIKEKKLSKNPRIVAIKAKDNSTNRIKTLLSWNTGLDEVVQKLNSDKTDGHCFDLYIRQSDPSESQPDVIIGHLGISHSGGMFKDTFSAAGFWNWNCVFYKVKQSEITQIKPQTKEELTQIALGKN